MDEEEAEAVSPQLKAVNKNLADYNTEWDNFVDCWLVLRVSMPFGRPELCPTVCRRGHRVRLACTDHCCRHMCSCHLRQQPCQTAGS